MRPLSALLLAVVFSTPSGARIAPPPSGLSVVDWAQIRAEYDRHRHTAFPDGDGFKARTRELGWNTRFDGRGFEIRPDDGAWRFGLQLAGQTNARVAVDKNRVTYAWTSNLEEWFLNEDRGLEHGFTVLRKSGPLKLHLAVRGTLRAEGQGTGVRFLNASGAVVLNYSGLKAWDADGKDLPARIEAIGGELRIAVEDRGARYPVTIDPLVQQAYLKPGAVGSTQAGDYFGLSAAISGDTVVVGAYGEDSSSAGVDSGPNELAGFAGAAYVFHRTNGVWKLQTYLKPSAFGTTQLGDFFGISVAISGDVIVVGASGEDSSTLGVNAGQNENATDAGAAYVFVPSEGGGWLQQAYLKPAEVGTTQAGDFFGTSVAVSGNTIVVGAAREAGSSAGVNGTPNENAAAAGAVYVFSRDAGAWKQEAYLKPAAFGATQAGDNLGRSVAISGDTIIAGAPFEDSASVGVNSTADETATNSGAAYVFTRAAGVWSQQAYLKPASVGTTQLGDQFGTAVSISGDTAVVGAFLEDGSAASTTPDEGAPDSGAAYVFVRAGAAWTQQAYLKASPTGTFYTNDNFGYSVAVSGERIVVGAFAEDSASLGINSTADEFSTDSGAAYVFARSAGLWTRTAYLKPAAVGTTQMADNFGRYVAISGDTVMVGGYLEDSSTLGINSTPNESAADSGAVYIFREVGPVITEVIDAGSLRPEIAASSWVTIKGTSLAPQTRIWVDSDFVEGRLPTALNGVSVTVDGKPAFVYYISPTQINVLAPALTRTGSVPVVVTTAEGTASFTATVKAQTPSWFMLDPENRKYVAAVNADGSIVGKQGLYPSAPNFTKPLPKGARALIYGTSWGPTNRVTPEGIVFGGAYNVAGASIKIGGQTVVIEFAGVVTPGLFQFNIIAPNLQPGDYLVEGAINGVSTQPGAYITLGP